MHIVVLVANLLRTITSSVPYGYSFIFVPPPKNMFIYINFFHILHQIEVLIEYFDLL